MRVGLSSCALSGGADGGADDEAIFPGVHQIRWCKVTNPEMPCLVALHRSYGRLGMAWWCQDGRLYPSFARAAEPDLLIFVQQSIDVIPKSKS